MLNDLFSKIKNKPGEQGGSQQQLQQMSAPAASAPGHVPDRVDILMEQVKNLIEINKTLNGKVKSLETQSQTTGQVITQLQTQLNTQMQRTQSFEQVIMKCTQVLARLQKGGMPAPAAQAPAPAPQPAQQPSVPAAPQPRAPTPPQPNAPKPPVQFTVDDVLARGPPQSNAPQAQAAPAAPSAPAQSAEAQPGNYFVLRNGAQLKNLPQLAQALQSMSDEEFQLYVNDYKNDLASWVRYCLNNDILGGELAKVKTRVDTLRVLQSYS